MEELPRDQNVERFARSALWRSQDRQLQSRTPPRLDDGRRLIRMFPEWGTELPLWESFTDHYLIGRDTLPISDALLAALTAWNAHWKDRSEDAPLRDEQRWRAQGRALVEELRSELHGIAEVRSEFDRQD